ncbi:hypothetical protein J25TS5_41680 [Paenibacillus faecis]|nr:hypothetical protein J25TS5_41680 [Paenibacillus faecis]
MTILDDCAIRLGDNMNRKGLRRGRPESRAGGIRRKRTGHGRIPPLSQRAASDETGRPGWMETAARKAGFTAGSGHAASRGYGTTFREAFNDWFSAAAESRKGGGTVREITDCALAFREGYSAGSGIPPKEIPLPLQRSASAVVTASNEEKTLPLVLSELEKLPLQEIMVVLNGCTDGSLEAVFRHPRVLKLHYPERLGHDVGRAVGAKTVRGETILFVDGDLPVVAEELAPFLLAVDRGTDMALNDITPFLPPFPQQDEVTRSKTLLNLLLGRPDLRANSLTAVPHALSRKLIDAIGTPALAVPPKAQALAIARGFEVTAPSAVNVLRKNRIRAGNTGAGNAVAKLIVGDHIEALETVMQMKGIRLDTTRLSRSELAKARNAR